MFPDWLTLGCSVWYGTTVYTNKNISKDHVICVTTFDNINKVDGHIITTYGNVFNHSTNIKEVNCNLIIQKNDLIKVVAKRDIEYGEELLINYDELIVKP